MIITEQAATVLQEIDEQLALADKATAGPWFQPQSAKHLIYTHPAGGDNVLAMDDRLGAYEDAAFIATSRTLLPASLRCLKTAIEGLLRVAFLETGASDESYVGRVAAYALTTLLDQWEATK